MSSAARGPSRAQTAAVAVILAGGLIGASVAIVSGCNPEKAAEERGRQRARQDVAEARGYREGLEAERDKAANAAAVSDAKMIALALEGRARDNGGNLPTREQAIKAGGMSKILRDGPYLREDADALDPQAGAPGGKGFVYTFPGGKLPGADAAPVELGYKPAPGGRAVIFANAPVKWQPTQP